MKRIFLAIAALLLVGFAAETATAANPYCPSYGGRGGYYGARQSYGGYGYANPYRGYRGGYGQAYRGGVNYGYRGNPYGYGRYGNYGNYGRSGVSYYGNGLSFRIGF